MNILINLSTLKSGGGQNVAMNFLHSFSKIKIDDGKIFFFVAKNSEPHHFLEKIKYPYFLVTPRNPLKRILFEIFNGNGYLNKNKIDIIYSYFGIGLFCRKIPQVSGSADSNLYFPEIDFWANYTGLARLKRWIVDLYRIWGIKRSDAVVFENEALELRAKKLFKLKCTKLIKPSINFEFENKPFKLPISIGKSVPKGLFLCGWHPNKNYAIIPEIASELKRIGISFHFLITAPLDNSSMHKNFEKLIHKYNVHDMVSVVGPVPKDQLQSLYDQIDYVFLLSKLESFSNNIIESWFFKKPLIISNAVWSRSICGDAAIYVERDNIRDIVDKVVDILSNDVVKMITISKGLEQLEKYPSIEKRIIQEMEFLKNVFKNS